MRTPILPAVLLAFFMVTTSSSDLTAGWTHNGAPVCTNGGVQETPQVVPDGEGGVFVVWNDSRTLTDVYAQRLDEMGRPCWAENGIVVFHDYSYQYRVKAVSDGAGGFIAVWEDSREEVQWDIYAQRIDADGNLLWPEGGVAVCTAVDDQNYPEICSDGANGCIITWVDERDSYIRDDIYAQRIDADGTPLWTIDGVAVCTADSTQFKPLIVSDGSGGAVIVWGDNRSDMDIYAQRLDPSGTALWAAGGVPVVNIPGENHYQHDIDTDGSGGVFVTWCDRQGSGLDVYLQRMNSAGSRAFAATGITLCNASSTQREPVITYDGEGGAIVAWVDFRNGSTDSDVYATRVSGAGTRLWTETNGEAVCNSPDQVYYLTVLSDSDGGGIFAWSDLRDFTVSAYDIYAQRLDRDGQLMWTIDGDSICKAPGSQAQTVMATDGGGGAILAWMDPRVGDTDIYAHRITAGADFVATTLSMYNCSFRGGSVTLTWTVSEPVDASSFSVCRKSSPDGEFKTLEGAASTDDGLGFRFADSYAEPGASYSYRVHIIEGGKSRVLFETGPVTIPEAGLTLYQNSPNPFNPSTTIAWRLDVRSRVTLDVFDAAGRKVAGLVDRDMGPGLHEAAWNGACTDGRQAASGIYMYRLTAGKTSLSRKMVLLR